MTGSAGTGRDGTRTGDAGHAVGFTRRMAGLLGLDERRWGQWVLARCLQESLGRPADLPPARALAP